MPGTLPEPRQGGCQPVLGIGGQSTCAFATGSLSRAAWTSAEGRDGVVPGQGRGWRLLGRPVAPPARLWQQAIRVGILLEHEAAIGVSAQRRRLYI